jgi:hypothetical protein
MRTFLACAVAAFSIVAAISGAGAGQSSRAILALGNASFIDAESVRQATGAEVVREPGLPLQDVAVLVLANAPFASLPQPIRDGLVEYVESGGAVLITGGSQSFGSGGYKAVSPILPFQVRSDNDWRFISFRPPVPLQPGHPILAGVTFSTVGTVNDMNPRPGATEILQSPGGGRAATPGGGSGGSYPYPLVAELTVGAGRVIGVAFDPSELAGMADRSLFVRNTLAYLLTVSRAGMPR